MNRLRRDIRENQDLVCLGEDAPIELVALELVCLHGLSWIVVAENVVIWLRKMMDVLWECYS